MKIYITDISIDYIDVTRMGDQERQSEPIDTLVRYEVINGNNALSGRLEIPFKEYENMTHAEIINSVYNKWPRIEDGNKGDIVKLVIDEEDVDFIKANINFNIIDFTIKSAIFHEKYIDSVRNKMPLWISVGKRGTDGISKIAQYYCVVAEKINENLYAYEFKEK